MKINDIEIKNELFSEFRLSKGPSNETIYLKFLGGEENEEYFKNIGKTIRGLENVSIKIANNIFHNYSYDSNSAISGKCDFINDQSSLAISFIKQITS